MSSDRSRIRSRKNITRLMVLFVAGLLFTVPIFAAEAGGASAAASAVQGLSAQSMINRIAGQIPMLMRMVTAIGYVLGMFLVFQGLMKLKEYGEARTQMSSQHHMKEPVMYLLIGAALLYLPTSVQIGMSTFWADPNPYGYVKEGDQWEQFLKNCYLVIQLFGTIAFIRGLLILSHGDKGGQGSFGKGVTHVLGGIFCINIYQFVKVILFTLGIET